MAARRMRRPCPIAGSNALDAVVSAYQSIAQLRQHIRQTERMHGIITEGGLAANIVPERAACRFYVRAADVHDLAALKKRVHACFEAAALSTGCTVDIHWGGTDYLDLKTNWPMADAFARNGAAIGREFASTKNIPPGFAGSTDMGNVSHRVPSIHPMLAVAPAGSHHSQRGVRAVGGIGQRRCGRDRRRKDARA